MSGAPPSVSRKFTFDTEFEGTGVSGASHVPYKRLYPAEEVERLTALARAEGEAAALATAEVRASEALGKIADAARAALAALAEAAHEHRVGSAELAMAAARKIADASCELFPEAPVKAALAALAREVEAQPRLIVQAAPELLERIQAALEETAHAIGYAGQIVARADPSLPLAAFVLDWGDGHAAFDPAAAAERVGAALEAALASEGLHGEALPIPETVTTET